MFLFLFFGRRSSVILQVWRIGLSLSGMAQGSEMNGLRDNFWNAI
jgi:hypothetical protein